jgi:hypothetical protein
MTWAFVDIVQGLRDGPEHVQCRLYECPVQRRFAGAVWAVQEQVAAVKVEGKLAKGFEILDFDPLKSGFLLESLTLSTSN